MTTTDLVSQADLEVRPNIPLSLHWTAPEGPRPLPVRVIRTRRTSRAAASLPAIYEPGTFHTNGRAEAFFNFSEQMHRLCAGIVARCEPFRHIALDRVLFGVTQARTSRTSGLQAKIVPMRFAGGERWCQRRGQVFQVQSYWVNGVEILYLITFCLPRFLNQSFDDKLITIFHELYHIAPEFNGDLRRYPGRYCIHTRSQKGYDRQMAGLVREYLSNGADPTLHGFLRLNFHQLEARYGRIAGTVVPVPKLVPIEG